MNQIVGLGKFNTRVVGIHRQGLLNRCARLDEDPLDLALSDGSGFAHPGGAFQGGPVGGMNTGLKANQQFTFLVGSGLGLGHGDVKRQYDPCGQQN